MAKTVKKWPKCLAKWPNARSGLKKAKST